MLRNRGEQSRGRFQGGGQGSEEASGESPEQGATAGWWMSGGRTSQEEGCWEGAHEVSAAAGDGGERCGEGRERSPGARPCGASSFMLIYLSIWLQRVSVAVRGILAACLTVAHGPSSRDGG